MSWVEKRQRTDRQTGRVYVIYRVRWRDETGQLRGVTLPRGTTEKQAKTFAHQVALKAVAGDLADIDAGKETLTAFAEHWWVTYAGPNLAVDTLERYAEVWNAHIGPRLGGHRLRDLKPQVLAGFRNDLARTGVGNPTILKCFVVLSGMLARAVEEGRIASNPATAVKKPPQRRQRDIVVVSPETVERVCKNLIDEDREGRGQRDATVVRLLAYSGTRPWSEGARLTWAKVRRDTLRVYATKTGRDRPVDLAAPLRKDLAEWRLASEHAADDDLVVPGSSGAQWSDSDVRNWRRRIWKPAIKAVGVDEGMVPYDLRHCFASLLLRDPGYTIVDVAAQLGHSVAVLSSTYAHTIDDLKGEEPMTASEQIRRGKVAVWGGGGEVIGL